MINIITNPKIKLERNIWNLPKISKTYFDLAFFPIFLIRIYYNSLIDWFGDICARRLSELRILSYKIKFYLNQVWYTVYNSVIQSTEREIKVTKMCLNCIAINFVIFHDLLINVEFKWCFVSHTLAPGNVVGFTVYQSKDDFHTAHVRWSLPALKDHNSILANYEYETNHSGVC